MTADHFEETLLFFLSRRPFKPFTMELNTGQRYEVDDPHITAFSEGLGVLLAPGGIPVYFDHESVNQIFDSPAHSAPGRGKRKR